MINTQIFAIYSISSIFFYKTASNSIEELDFGSTN